MASVLKHFYQPKEKYFNILAGIIFSLSVILKKESVTLQRPTGEIAGQ